MNVDRLLEPISAEHPCGDDLSFSLEFDAILEKRREDDPTLDQGDWVRALKIADWPGVVADCEALLVRRTKDLRVAGWLTDAAARTRGFAGLADGLELCERLCATWWEGLHPLPEEGGMEQRAGSLGWLLGQVVDIARRAPVIAAGDRRHGLGEIDAARAQQQSVARGAVDAAAAQGTLTLDEVVRLQGATPQAFLVANLADLKRGLGAMDRLQAGVDPRLGAEGPSFGAARQALEDALAAAERFARGPGAAIDPAPGPPAVADACTGRAPALSVADALQNRAQALRQLRAVAEFFRRTEPHSPVAYLADKAAAWGEMPLHAWLRAVLKDPGALAQVEEMLGVEPPANSNG